MIWRGPMLHKAIEQFVTEAWWGEPDFILIDMPPGTGDVALTLSEVLPRVEIYVVTTPQPAAERVAQRSAWAARKMKLAVRGVIENMSWFIGDDGTRYELFGAGGGEQLAHQLGVPLLGQVPAAPEILTLASDDDDFDVVVDVALVDQVGIVMPHAERRGIELLWPVERDVGDSVLGVLLEPDVLLGFLLHFLVIELRHGLLHFL